MGGSHGTVTLRVWIELSGENPALARAELDAVVGRLEGQPAPTDAWLPPPWEEREIPDLRAAGELARCLALARRVAIPWRERGWADVRAAMNREGARGSSASLRDVGARGASKLGAPWRELAQVYVDAGGAIDLTAPARRFRVIAGPQGDPRVAEEVSVVDRGTYRRRRMPELPFQRPVSLPPRLGRAAANLGRIGPGDRVIDPFLGTGALLIEAALLGASVSGVDRDPEMVRGALRNFAFVGVEPSTLRVADASDATLPTPGGQWDAILTDPPYGRASTTGGEDPVALVARTLPRWAELVRPGGRVVVVVPGGPDPLPPPWIRETSVIDRVHRSLSREFRVYRRASVGSD